MWQKMPGAITEVQNLFPPWFGVSGDVEDCINLNKLVAFKATVEDPCVKDEVRVRCFLEGCGESMDVTMTHARYNQFLNKLMPWG